MPRDYKNPPSWAKNAIATERGWEDPKTGELLVSLRGLKAIRDDLLAAEGIKDTIVAEVNADPIVEEEAPKPKPKTKKKKATVTKEAITDEIEQETEKPIVESKELPEVRVETDIQTEEGSVSNE